MYIYLHNIIFILYITYSSLQSTDGFKS